MIDQAKPHDFNYFLHVARNSISSVASNFASPNIVLPALFLWAKLPLIFISFLIPLNAIGTLIGTLIAPLLLNQASMRKRVSALTNATDFILLMLMIGVVEAAPKNVQIIFFLVASFSIGIIAGIASISDREVISRTVPHGVVGRLYSLSGALGGALTIIVLCIIHFFVPYSYRNGSHIMFLWLAAVIWLISTLLILSVREPHFETTGHKGIIDNMRTGIQYFFQERWYKLYYLGRLISIIIPVSITFYVVHALTFHEHHAKNVSALMLAMSIGYILGGIIWKYYIMKNTVLPLFLSGLIIFCAALFSWLYESEFIPHNIYYYSIIFVFIAISIEGRGNSLNAYIASYAPEEVRPQLISASQFSQNAVIFALSFLAGLLAHLYSPIWGVLSISAGGLLVSLVAILMMSVENLQES